MRTEPYVLDRTRFILATLIVIVLAYLFWTGSRYPALDEKAMMSGAIQLEDPLGFEAAYPLTDDMGLVERVFFTTLNWINTNKKGMTFGVLFAAAFLTAAPYLRRRSFRSGWANSWLGLAIGTPLGVCVNCAAPIARGMYSGGLRAETTLSAMIASPTLNVVVLTMLFSLLPFYMAVAKIGLSLFVILVVVPLICRRLPEVEAPVGASPVKEPAAPPRPGLHLAFRDVAQAYARNLWYIVKMTVPLMLLAGFLGATVATLLPQELITGLDYSLIALVLIAIVGVFLPVPIAFDVVVTGALLALGLSHGYVMALLFTLGSFSIYSFFIVTQTVGLRAGLWLMGCVAGLGILAGVAAHHYHEWQTERALRMLTTEAAPMMWAAQAAGADPWTVTSADADRITVTATPFAPPSPGDGGFTRLEAWEIGIDQPVEFSMEDMWPPFWEGRSLASGDVDNDGDIDLVVASTDVGLRLFLNDGAGRFAQAAVDLGPLTDAPVFNAVIVDIDNDGWRDLFLATYARGNFVLPGGPEGFGAPIEVANREGAVLSMALTFADPDRDGDLDVALGNWASGWYRRIPGEESRNRLIWNDNGELSADNFLDLPGIPGETLSILFSDLDRDGFSDLIVGNDFEVPDYVYRGGPEGLTAVTFQDGLIQHTTTTTMAVKTADLLNDGTPELYLAQIAGRSSGVAGVLKMQPLERYCDGIERDTDRATCEANMEIKSWYRSGNSFDPTYAGRCAAMTGALQAECKAMLIKDLAIQRKDAGICDLIPADRFKARNYCAVHFRPSRPIRPEEADAALPQIKRSNVLLAPGPEGYTDVAADLGLSVGGWSWDTKIADFDEDGWQDVYIVNGTWVPNEVSPSNLYFHNTGEGRFTEASGPMGLEDYLMTAAATRFDMDGDGDLDMVTYPVNGPLAVFRNDTQDGYAIALTFEDHAGNRDGIGAVVTLTDETGATRSREIQLGGGFMSFDAPEVHVGLGAARQVNQVSIRWADGSETLIDGRLQAEARYHIRRAP